MPEYLYCYAIIYRSEDDDGNERYYTTKDTYSHSNLCECVDFDDLDEIEPKFAMYPVGKIKLFCCDLCLDRIFSSFLYDSSFPETNLELDWSWFVWILVIGIPR